jgi:hypothetical protein
MLDRETVYSYIGELEGEFEKKEKEWKKQQGREKKTRWENIPPTMCVSLLRERAAHRN